MRGFLRQRVLQVLTVANPRPRTIYLSRHGFSEYNVLGKLGGNPPISKWGEMYAERLGAWAAEHIQKDKEGKPVKASMPSPPAALVGPQPDPHGTPPHQVD